MEVASGQPEERRGGEGEGEIDGKDVDVIRY